MDFAIIKKLQTYEWNLMNNVRLSVALRKLKILYIIIGVL